jgi:hypothetical protein
VVSPNSAEDAASSGGSRRIELAAVLARLLSSAAQGDLEVARSQREIIAGLGPTPLLKARLDGIVSGRIGVTMLEALFFVQPQAELPLERIARCAATALKTVGELLQRHPPLIWVDFSRGSEQMNSTHAEIPGVRRMSFSVDLFAEPDWESVVWHECAHAMLLANCRFLDEGWAVWCQYQYCADTQYPIAREELECFELPESIAGIPIVGLLRGGEGDYTFHRLSRDEDEQRAIYVRALRFFDTLRSSVGWSALCAAYDRVYEGADPVHELNALCNGSVVSLEPGGVPTIDGIDRAFRALRCQAKFCDADPFIALVRAYVERHTEDSRAFQLLGRLLGYTMLAPRSRRQAADAAAELRRVIARLAELDPRAPLERIFRAYLVIRDVLDAMQADEMGAVNLVAVAERYMLDAEIDAPENGDVRLAMARFELNRPTPDRIAALEHLAIAARDPECAEEALAIAATLSRLARRTSSHTRASGLLPGGG